MNNLDQRVARLEQLSNRWRAMALSLVIMLSACLTVAMASAQTAPSQNIRAQSISLVDADGKEFVQMGLDPHGIPSINLISRNGKANLLLVANDQGQAGLAIRGGTLEPGLSLFCAETSSYIKCRTAGGTTELANFASKGGILVVRQPDQKMLASIAGGSETGGMIALFDKDGRPKFAEPR